MTPLKIKLILFYYTGGEGDDSFGSPAGLTCLDDIVSAGIIAPPQGGGRYEMTEKGIAYMKCLLDTPYPTSAWIDAHGDLIEVD